MTPDSLALAIVRHFLPQIKGKVLEPCAGQGAFLRAFQSCGLSDVETCEITEGKDFYDYNSPVDWIITNPPWSKLKSLRGKSFLTHSYEIADNIVFLVSVNAILGSEARLRDMNRAGFGIKEVRLYNAPPSSLWPSSGFQLAAIHLQRGCKCLFTRDPQQMLGKYWEEDI